MTMLAHHALLASSYTAAPPTGIAYASDFIAAVQAAGGTLTEAQQQALQQLQTDLVAGGLLDSMSRAACKLRTWWPVVGGSAQAHRVNFVDPTAYALTFVGSPIHNALGYKPNGVNQYANTGFMLDSAPGFAQGAALHFYAGENLPQNEPYDFGVYNGIGALHLSTRLDALGGIAFGRAYTRQYELQGTAASINGSGFFTLDVKVNSPTSVTGTIYRYQQVLVSATYMPESSPGGNDLYLSALNLNEMPYGYSATRCAGAGVSYDLTTVEHSALQQAVQQFNTTLNRAV